MEVCILGRELIQRKRNEIEEAGKSHIRRDTTSCQLFSPLAPTLTLPTE
jgi:hypothetical protein